MEKRINTKARIYLQKFKDDIRDSIISTFKPPDDALGQYTVGESQTKNISSILQYLYDYQPLEFEKVDFQKRKRIKNVVPLYERCCALRANKEQCTRRKKGDDKFCGTHIKGTPHGEINQINTVVSHTKKEVWAQDIKGIIYYIDKEGNVYDPQDIIENNINPKIIAKYIFENNIYHIPSLFKK